MGKDAHFIWPTHTLNYYTPATIRDLLAREGSTGVRRHRGARHRRLPLVPARGAGQTDAGVEAIADLLQFFVNAGAYGKNLRVIGRTPR
jgi:hypothetical protein